MKSRFSIAGLPKITYVLVGAAALFVAVLGVSLASRGGGDDEKAAISTTPSINNIDEPLRASPTASPVPTQLAVVEEASPTPEPEPNRENCNAIRGTAYVSVLEREWYLNNCLNQPATAAATSGSGGGSSGGGGSGAASPRPSGEASLGTRLVVPGAGINAPVTATTVGSDGTMPDPIGYFNAVLYDFPNHPGLGGSNKVLAGHVDCGRCINGGPGTAVFYSVRNLGAGSTAQWYNSDGSVENYVAIASYSLSAEEDFTDIVASGAADLTLITCTGTFSSGEYDRRHVVQFRRA